MYELKDIQMMNNDLENIDNIYSNVSTNFKNSININPNFKNEIENIYARTLLNLGRSTLCMFHLKYISMFESLSKYYGNDEELVEFSNSLISFINNYFEDLDSNLNIKTKHDLDNLKYILNISLFLLEEVINDKNIDLAYESFFQIERKINKKNLYKKSNKILDLNILVDNRGAININHTNMGLDNDSIIKIHMIFKGNNFGGDYYEV